MAQERRRKPPTSPEELESRLISLAADEAERQMSEGIASAQVVVHFLKLGSSRERLEQEKLRHETEMLEVKRESIKNAENAEVLYREALSAMRKYSGHEEPPEDYDD